MTAQAEMFEQPMTTEEVAAQHRGRTTNRTILRQILADGRWHTDRELDEACGRRFGARLFEIRHGVGAIPPLVVHRIWNAVWRYRADPSGDLMPGCSGPCCAHTHGPECGAVSP